MMLMMMMMTSHRQLGSQRGSLSTFSALDQVINYNIFYARGQKCGVNLVH